MVSKQAKKVASLMNSIAVGVHLTYDHYQNFDAVTRVLTDIGIKHIRDGNRVNIPKLKQLAAKGIKTNFILNAYDDGIVPNNTYAISKMVDGQLVEDTTIEKWDVNRLIAEAGTDVIESVEAFNEIDLNSHKYFWSQADKSRVVNNPASAYHWVNYIDKVMRDLYAAVKANPNAANVLVVGAALGGTYTFDGKTPLKPCGSFIDRGNGHYYGLEGGNGFNDMSSYIGINAYYANVAFPGNLEGRDLNNTTDLGAGEEGNSALQRACYEPPYEGKPMFITECGGHTGWAQHNMSYKAHGKFIPRLYAEHFRLGFARSFIYELVNMGSNAESEGGREESFGLVQTDFTYKPGAVQLKAMIAALGDVEDNRASTDSLDYTLTYEMPAGYTKVGLVKDILLQKANGNFMLLVYHNIGSVRVQEWRNPDLDHPDVKATLKLPKGYSIKNTTLRYDTALPTPFTTTNVSSYSFSVNDTVTILELAPYVAPVTPPPTPTTPPTTMPFTSAYTLTKLGDASVVDMDITLKASGFDIWENSDRGSFYYRQAASTTPTTVVCKVESIIGGTEDWAKSGIMIRETLDHDSRAIGIFTTKAVGTLVQLRNGKGGYTEGLGYANTSSAPIWLKAVRDGAKLTLSYSKDGTTYTALHTVTNFDFSTNYYIGLAATSHNNSQVTTTKFTGLSL